VRSSTGTFLTLNIIFTNTRNISSLQVYRKTDGLDFVQISSVVDTVRLGGSEKYF
jgi:hypothetical protein